MIIKIFAITLATAAVLAAGCGGKEMGESTAPAPTRSSISTQAAPTPADPFLGVPTGMGLCTILTRGRAALIAPSVTGGRECYQMPEDSENVVRMGRSAIGSGSGAYGAQICPERLDYRKSIMCFDSTSGVLDIWANGEKNGVTIGLRAMSVAESPTRSKAFALGKTLVDNLK